MQKSIIIKRGLFFRRCVTLLLCISLLMPMSTSIGAADTVTATSSEASGQAASRASADTANQPKVFINGTRYNGYTFIYNSTTYVGIREYAIFMGATGIDWNASEKCATITSDNLKITAKYRDTYIIANGRYLWAKDGILIKEGTMYVPIRAIAKAFGGTVDWDPSAFSAFVCGSSQIASGDSYYDSDEVLWLSRIINAEAGVESLLGKIAVGTVVLNRVKSELFPSTIYGVIFDKANGVQFTPAANGTIYNKPDADSIIAAKLCLDGATVSDGALFFVNVKIAKNTWVSDNRPFIMTIGNHSFYS